MHIVYTLKKPQRDFCLTASRGIIYPPFTKHTVQLYYC
jgi:hypothetical protein